MSWFVIVFQIFVPTDFYSSKQYHSLLPDPCTHRMWMYNFILSNKSHISQVLLSHVNIHEIQYLVIGLITK